jgi:hypothetical protein
MRPDEPRHSNPAKDLRSHGDLSGLFDDRRVQTQVAPFQTALGADATRGQRPHRLSIPLRPLPLRQQRGLYKQKYLPSGAPANDDRVTSAILHGRGMMPSFASDLNDQQLNDLIAYLHTL